MLNTLKIFNFKSIKNAILDCKRINIFIGEPNTGKSNILEVVGLLSHLSQNHKAPLGRGGLRDFVRFGNMTDLFYDHLVDNDIRIEFNSNILEVKFHNGRFSGLYSTFNEKSKEIFRYSYEGEGHPEVIPDSPNFRFYRFVQRDKFPNEYSEFLDTPDGSNLISVILTHKELRELFRSVFERFGLKLVVEPVEKVLKVQKELEDIVISLPYSLTSETLQRLVFYITAIYSNRKSILAFEEPEAHAFPYYTKYLAEMMALDRNENQYMVSTHNPYFLLSLIEKTPKEDLAVFCTYVKNFQTKLKALTEKDIEDVSKSGIDLFFNIDQILG